MSKYKGIESLPAPCIIDEGIVVNPEDIKRLLSDLCYVRYIHQIGGKETSRGEGYIQEIFDNSNQSTMIANKKIYINIQSFDYLSLSKSTEDEVCFNLIQDTRQLSIVPISRAARSPGIAKEIDTDAIEAVVTEVLTARLDVQLDFENEQ